MKKNISGSLILVFLSMLGFNVNAQYVQYTNGKPIIAKDYTDIEGSPYIVDKWTRGIVKLNNGKTYDNIMLKYNEVLDELYFKDGRGEMLGFVDNVNEFEINYISDDIPYKKIFKKGFKNIPNFTTNSFFEILSDGTAQLLKKTNKYILEAKEYNSSVITKTFKEDVKYYLIISGKATQIKKDKKAILTLLNNKQSELEEYIRNNDLNLKNDADLSKLITYYNSI